MNKTKSILLILVVLVIALIITFSFSGSKSSSEKSNQPKQKLYVYNWTEYITSDLLKKFTDETGIEVVYTTYESNEEMYAKLKLNSNSSQPYDIVVPSNHFVARLIAENLIQPLDLSQLQTDNLLPEVLNKPFDPENKYSIPYTYGFTTIGIDKSYAPNLEIKSWNDLWKPEFKDLMILNDQRDLFSIALKSLGYDPNTTNPDEIKQAYEKLATLVNKVKVFNSDAPEVPFVNKEVQTGILWTGSAFRGSIDDSDISVMWPEEGAVQFIDSFVIPVGAKNTEEAYQFINFMLQPENAYEILVNLGFQPANRLIKDLLPIEWQNSTILFPPEWVFEKSSFNADVDNKTLELYNKYWNQLRVSGNN
ncbi:PotD/PotF family extracellular solute-binding protein [Psittacicella hinzii]|uniref:ABC transporter substrate-binding protein n=1 Tax=Psittacicella hinzii TaxID=2028575 RepID=UPI001CA6C559|nr:spermidine/putrescine ABC transporter substrate-binding protein [Psittacicella hinzii]